MVLVKKPLAHTLEESLNLLKEMAEKEEITIRTLFEVLSGRGYPLMIIALSLPFCIPIQIPGLSTPFGLIIALLGLREVLGRRILLPNKILNKKIAPATLEKIIQKTIYISHKFRRFTHPRMVKYFNNSVANIINGLVIFILGLLLALPVPIPLTNLASAWSLLFLNIGILEDDGIFIIVGYLMTILCFGFFIALLWLAYYHL